MFTTVLKTALVTGALIGAITTPAAAQNQTKGQNSGSATRGVVLKTNGSVEATVEALKKMLAKNGMMVMGEINQGKVLGMTGLKLQSDTLFVGNPNVGKQLFSEDPGVGLVVPIRINIYADQQGQTHVHYIPPSQQLRGFGNAKIDKIAKMLDGKFENMAGMLLK